MEVRMGKRIGVFSQKGGVGKTTICEALGVTYTLGGWDVLLADLTSTNHPATNG